MSPTDLSSRPRWMRTPHFPLPTLTCEKSSLELSSGHISTTDNPAPPWSFLYAIHGGREEKSYQIYADVVDGGASSGDTHPGYTHGGNGDLPALAERHADHSRAWGSAAVSALA